MPITMKWVDSLFNSDSLPYPDISPRPRARANMSCDNGEWGGGYRYCHLGPLYYAFLLTGYYHPQWSYPFVYSDSFVFAGSGNMLPEHAIEIFLEIVPHNDPIPAGLEEPNSLNFNIFPNPAFHTIEVATPLQGLFNLHIYAIDGRWIKSIFDIPQPTLTIDISSLPKGLYIVRIENEKANGHRKFIVK